MPLEFRRATSNDFDSMVELQNQNLATHLSDDEKKDGFLSGSFTAAQFAELNDDLAVVVCIEGLNLVGFLCTSSVAFNKNFKLPATMIERFDQIIYHDRPLSSYRTLVGGPVCIDRSLRGRGIFESLYSVCLIEIVPAEYEVATTLVSTQNPRSIGAHEKVEMKEVDRFDFLGQMFVTMARPVRT